jgi:hypothetical protein
MKVYKGKNGSTKIKVLIGQPKVEKVNALIR